MRGGTTGRRARRLLTATVVAAFAVAALAGCTKNGLEAQYEQGTNQGYIKGDGSVTELPIAKRTNPVHFSGKTEDGSTWNSKDYLGKVVVVNFWYAQCGPCRVEAKQLESDYTQFAPQGVVFIGVNTEDSAANINTFNAKYGVGYPSLLDSDSGEAQLAFSGSYRPNATPTTIVLDKKGRVADRIEGPLTDNKGTLEALVTTALGEAG